MMFHSEDLEERPIVRVDMLMASSRKICTADESSLGQCELVDLTMKSWAVLGDDDGVGGGGDDDGGGPVPDGAPGARPAHRRRRGGRRGLRGPWKTGLNT